MRCASRCSSSTPRRRRRERAIRRAADPAAAAARPPPAAAGAVGASPQRAATTARWADYTPASTTWRSTASRPTSRRFPKSDTADDAQVTSAARICRQASTTRRSKPTTSRSAPIRPATCVPEAYYKKGLALSEPEDSSTARASAYEPWSRRIPTARARWPAAGSNSSRSDAEVRLSADARLRRSERAATSDRASATSDFELRRKALLWAA